MTRTAAPEALIDGELLKLSLGVEVDDEDVLLELAAAAAIEHIDGYEGLARRALLTQSWTLTLPCGFPCCREIELPLPPLQSVEAVRYLDLAEAEQTLSAALYRIRVGMDGRVILKVGSSWPAAREVYIDFTCGYGAADEVPQRYRMAALLLAADAYSNRGEVPSQPNPAVDRLIRRTPRL